MNPPLESSPPLPNIRPRREQSYSLVLISGTCTAALALLGVYLLDRYTDDFHIMGWYANYVLPAGAFIVGLLAGSGYGLASWFTGIKITRRLLWLVVLMQLGTYFAAQYIEFHNLHLIYSKTHEPVSFFTYYDATARAFAWKQNNGSAGEPLGMWGYCFRLLEIVGFVGGGLIAPAVLAKAPYCAGCQRYMRTRDLALVPATVPARKVKRSDTAGQAALQAEQTQAFELGKETVARIGQLASENKAADFRAFLETLVPGKKAAGKLPAKFSLHLVVCERCFAGRFLTRLSVGQGNQITVKDFAQTELPAEFVRSVDPKSQSNA